MLRTTSLAAIGLALLAGTTTAQIQLNEIYASHTGTDDMEFIELKGPGGTKLDGYMVLAVEGDSTSAGILDRAFDLKGQTIPTDGYFVMGDSGVANVDLTLTIPNNGGVLENGTVTIYLVKTTDTSKITALVGKSVEDTNNKTKTILPTLGTIVDIIAMVDTGISSTDKTYDGAVQIGPDGRFFPPGIYRTGDAKWCDQAFLDFDDVANKNAPSTSGSKNTGQCLGAMIKTTGNSCLTGAGTTGGPDLSGTEPAIGKTFKSIVQNAATGANGFVYGGVEASPTAFLGCSIYLNIAAFVNLGALTFNAGTGTLDLPLPYSVSLLGTKFATQAAVSAGSDLWLTNATTGQIGY